MYFRFPITLGKGLLNPQHPYKYELGLKLDPIIIDHYNKLIKTDSIEMMGKLFKEYHGEEINKLVGAFFIEKNNAIIHFLEESYHQEFFELNFEFDTCDKFHFPFDKFWSFTLYLKSQSFLKMKEINEPEKMIWWLSSKEEFINGYSNKREKVVTVINPLTHLEICEMEREF